MADDKPHPDSENDASFSASQPRDIYSVLSSVIRRASGDEKLLRHLVYTLARQNVKPYLGSSPREARAWNMKSPPNAAQTMALELAIQQVEAELAKSEARSASVNANQPTSAQGRPVPGFDDMPSADQHDEPEQLVTRAVVTVPEQPIRLNEAWPDSRVSLTRAANWLDPGIRVALDDVQYAPIDDAESRRAKISPFLQLGAVCVLGIGLYIVVSMWFRQPIPNMPTGLSPQATQPVSPLEPREALSSPSATAKSDANLPFPMPQSYGVFAIDGSRLVSLEALPIKVPIARVMVSAEITQPTKAMVQGDSLSFVVYRRDLVASAPQSATIRVVARVTRSLSFVEGKPKVTPIQNSWRIRDISYDLSVTPIESNKELVLIKPEANFVFQPGRYALVLNGYGYEFSVQGKITAPEQCLEQTQVTNGIVVTECPQKS